MTQIVITYRELHVIGEYVAVCWNLVPGPTQTCVIDGVEYTAKPRVRSGKPYIDFVTLRRESDGKAYEDDDIPVVGGISLAFARQIATELERAIAYLENTPLLP